MDVRHVGYVGLNTRNLDRAVDYYRNILGLEVTERDDTVAYLRCNANHHSLVLYQSDTLGAREYGFQMVDEAAVQTAARDLQAAGIPFSTADVKGQGASVRFTDPSGFKTVLYSDMLQVDPHYGPRAFQPRKLEHITSQTTDIVGQARFYEEVLGFRVSDWIERALVWLRCDPEHHGVAFIQDKVNKNHHFAWQLTDWSQLRVAGDHLLANGVRVLFGPGRHGPGNNLFMYFRDPEGYMNELSCDIQHIWDDELYRYKVWENVPESINRWGPPPPPEFME